MPTFDTRWLATAALLSALLAIVSAPWGVDLPWLNFVFKPLTTLLIIAHAWPRGARQPAQRAWVLAGLAWSLGGDVALLWPHQGFLPGLVSFLLAHLCYLVAFTRDVRLAERRGPFVLYAVVAGLILWHLWPGVPAALHLPVAAYVLCLASMAAQAAVVGWRSRDDGPPTPTVTATGRRPWRSQRFHGALLALGGALFVLSDALLAINRFGTALPLSGLWILCSYWLAQWCIASWLPAAAMPDRPRSYIPLNKPE